MFTKDDISNKIEKLRYNLNIARQMRDTMGSSRSQMHIKQITEEIKFWEDKLKKLEDNQKNGHFCRCFRPCFLPLMRIRFVTVLLQTSIIDVINVSCRLVVWNI